MGKAHTTNSPAQTKKIAQGVAEKVLKRECPSVLALEGDLGAGKTTFLQGLAKGLGIKEKVLSPTFVIMKKFEIPESSFSFLYHFDCYRIQKPEEITELGFKEIIKDPENIIAVEWAGKIEDILPRKLLKVKFEFIDEKTRKICF